MATRPAVNNPVKQTRNGVHRRKILVGMLGFIAGLIVLAGLIFWHISAVSAIRSAHQTAPSSTVDHTPAEVVDAVTVLYRDYLPLKAETVAKVGDNPLMEPALVQVLRASADEFSPDFYQAMLGDYMKEYQSTGKVTKDEVACANNAVAVSSVVFASATGHDALINVTLKLADGNSFVLPVTVDQTTLTAKKIACP